jgi:hypothetical protein
VCRSSGRLLRLMTSIDSCAILKIVATLTQDSHISESRLNNPPTVPPHLSVSTKMYRAVPSTLRISHSTQHHFPVLRRHRLTSLTSPTSLNSGHLFHCAIEMHKKVHDGSSISIQIIHNCATSQAFTIFKQTHII